MMTIIEARLELAKAKRELAKAIMNNNYEETPRLLTLVSVLKDTLLECYSKANAKNVVSSVMSGDVNVSEDSTTDTSSPLRFVK